MAISKVIETPRLQLRPPMMEDAVTIFTQYAQDAEVTKYLVWRPHQTIETTHNFLRRCCEAWEVGTALSWVIMRREDNQLVGMVGLRLKDYHADIGYVLARPYWGQEFATEVVRTLVNWSLAQSSIYRIWAVCDLENYASARVLEKSGMNREGVLRRWLVHPNVSDEPRDCACYAKVK